MKVLTIGIDRKLFEESSAVRERVISYGKRMEELHIVVFSLKNHNLSKQKISDNVFIYPTNSSSRYLYVLDSILISRRIVIENKFVRGDSVITCQDPYSSGFVGFVVSWLFRLPLHLQIHTDIFSPYFRNSIISHINFFTARFLIPKATSIRVVSKRIAESIKSHFIKTKKEIEVLPIAIDKNVYTNIKPFNFNLNYPNFNFYILMSARLEKEKRISDAILALKEIVKQYPNVGLFVAGSGREENNLKKLAEDNSLKNNVVFLGFRNDVKELMAGASMYLSVSQYEGYGMSMIEAGLCRCPVVSSNVGVADDILINNKNSIIFEIGDIMSISKNIIYLLERNDVREVLSNNLYEDVVSHLISQDEYLDKYIKQLESCLV